MIAKIIPIHQELVFLEELPELSHEQIDRLIQIHLKK